VPSAQAQQAHSYRTEQAERAAAGAAAVAELIASQRPWASVLPVLASYQLASAAAAVVTMAQWLGNDHPTIDPRTFAGVSSAGYAIAEPLIATIDKRIPAPAAAIPDPWWQRSDVAKFHREIEQLVSSEIQDAARSAAQSEMVSGSKSVTRYVRVLTPPTCKRCAVLAGKIYQDLDGFERHPGCDCVHKPFESWEAARKAGLVVSPEDAYAQGYIRDLTAGEKRAIEDGADINQVINSSSGISTADQFGRRVKTTRYGATKRSLWRKRNPSALVRLRPESIYRIVDEEHGGDRDIARQMLFSQGYILSA